MEGCQIIEFHKALEKEFPETQFLWHLSTSNRQYRCNVNLEDSLTTIMDIVKKCISLETPLLHLTARGSFVYFSEE